MKGHPVAYSRSVITELMVPSYTNFGGKVHGGTLMSLMDKLAYVCASKHAGNYCVTVSVDNVQFSPACRSRRGGIADGVGQLCREEITRGGDQGDCREPTGGGE